VGTTSTDKMATIAHAFRHCNRLSTVNKPIVLIERCARCLSSCSDHQSAVFQNSWKLKGTLDVRLYQVRNYSAPGKRGFIGQIIDNFKQDPKTKEMQDELRKFREEADKLDQSEALQKARAKYQAIESETTKGSEVLKKSLTDLQGKLKETISEAEKIETIKKIKDISEEIGKTTEKISETVGQAGKQLGDSQVFKSVSEGVAAGKKEIDDVLLSRARMYRPPAVLRKRQEHDGSEEKVFEANEEATGVQLHKDSKFYQSWSNFKDNNQYVHKLFDLKTRFDESDNVMVRATRTFTDKFSELFGGMFSKTEMSEVLTEIMKMDPNFTQEGFMLDCQNDIIPNVLEGIVRGDLEILQDWCHEGAFNVLAHPIRTAHAANYIIDNKVLDVNHLDIAAGKMMDQGPVLVITFQAQQIMSVRDKTGKVVEGDPDKIMRVFYVWALCRDQTILDPRAAWRIVDLSASPAEQWV